MEFRVVGTGDLSPIGATMMSRATPNSSQNYLSSPAQ